LTCARIQQGSNFSRPNQSSSLLATRLTHRELRLGPLKLKPIQIPAHGKFEIPQVSTAATTPSAAATWSINFNKNYRFPSSSVTACYIGNCSYFTLLYITECWTHAIKCIGCTDWPAVSLLLLSYFLYVALQGTEINCFHNGRKGFQ